MIRFLWKASRGYRLCPWRSPYIRWRMETYWGGHADEITFASFWMFLWQHRKDMTRFLHWAERMAQ